MDPAFLLGVLVAIPPLLMATAHIYAVTTQDTSRHCVVVLLPRADASQVAANHSERHHVRVLQVFSGSVKAYLAFVPVRKMQALRQDQWVLRIEDVDGAGTN